MKIKKISSDIADFAKSTIGTVGDSLEHGRDVVGESIAEGVHASSRRLNTVANIVGAYMSLRSLARAVDSRTMRGALGAIGLQRRPSALSTVLRAGGYVLVGAAVGVGVTMLIAPQSGTRTREVIRDRLRAMRGRPDGAVEETAEKVEERGKETISASRPTVNVSRNNTSA